MNKTEDNFKNTIEGIESIINSVKASTEVYKNILNTVTESISSTSANTDAFKNALIASIEKRSNIIKATHNTENIKISEDLIKLAKMTEEMEKQNKQMEINQAEAVKQLASNKKKLTHKKI